MTSSTVAVPEQQTPITRTNQPVRRWEWPDWHAVWHYRGLLFLLVWRELRSKYQQTVLGFGWLVVYPLLQTLIYTIVFGAFLNAPSGDLPYVLFTLSGVITWLFFSQTISSMSNSLQSHNALIQKLYFPRLLLPLTVMVTNLVDWIVALLILIVVAFGYGITPTWRLIWLPVFFLGVSLAASAFGLWLAPLQVRYRDVQQLLPLVMRFWFFFSPIVYSRQVVPQGVLGDLYALNPLVPILDGVRWMLLGQGEMAWAPLFYLLGVVLVLNVAGLVFFERNALSAADWA